MPRCKNCKVKFVAKEFNGKFCKGNIDCLTAEGLYKLEMLKKSKAKELKTKTDSWRPDTHLKENKKALQDEINKLAKLIDSTFGLESCIDCDKHFGKNQIHGAHYHDVGGNSTLRYNLHNIHSSLGYCNKYDNNHHSGYTLGLEKRYGKEYLEMVEGLPLQYEYIKLTSIEVAEKLKIVRKLIRDFHTFDFIGSWSARKQLNLMIGIYKDE
jgi:hypothetical protein